MIIASRALGGSVLRQPWIAPGWRRRNAGLLTAAGLVLAGLIVLFLTVDLATAELLIGLTLLSSGTVGLVTILYAGPIRSLLLREAQLLAEPTLLRGLPRRRTLVSILSATYKMPPELVRPIAHAVLGGPYDHPEDGQPVISSRTTIHYELADAPNSTYHLVATVTESYARPIRDDRLVVFATCDSQLEKRVPEAATPQIFDTWVTYDQALFRSYTEESFETLGIGIRYQDIRGAEHVRDIVQAISRKVEFDEWDQYLSCFNGGSLPLLDPRDYRETLRIYEYSLSDLEITGHELAAVTEVTTRTRTEQSISDQHCFWVASHPSLIDTFSFDVSRFGLTSEGPGFEYRLLSFLMKGYEQPQHWIAVDSQYEVRLQSLFLPGHGVALLWRPPPHANG